MYHNQNSLFLKIGLSLDENKPLNLETHNTNDQQRFEAGIIH